MLLLTYCSVLGIPVLAVLLFSSSFIVFLLVLRGLLGSSVKPKERGQVEIHSPDTPGYVWPQVHVLCARSHLAVLSLFDWRSL